MAMDETSVYFGNQVQTTVEQRGATSIRVPSTGYDSLRVTCILSICLGGQKLPPFLVLKGSNERIEERQSVIIVYATKAWSTQSVIMKWIERTFPLVYMGSSRGLLFWDSASTHRAIAMRSFLSSRRIDQVVIPAGMTSYLQSLDIAINKPFKDSIREEINDYIEHRMQRNERGNFVKPSVEELCRWVRNAWDGISTETLWRALTLGYVGRDVDFSTTFIEDMRGSEHNYSRQTSQMSKVTNLLAKLMMC